MQNEMDAKGVRIREIQTASEYLSMIDAGDADAEFYGAVSENDEDVYAVCRQDEIVGLSYICEEANAFLYVYIFPKYRNQGYGRAAARMSERRLDASKLRDITTCYDVNSETARKFAEACGFKKEFSSAYMEYTGGAFEERPLPIRQYRDEDYAQAQKLSAEAFHKMRVGTGCFPNSAPEEPSAEMRRHWADTAGDRYVYVLGDEIVGYACLDGGELSCVAIKISRQGKGLGKGFVRFLVNRLLEKGYGKPYLYCVVGNKARFLYDSLGFREAACGEYAKKCVRD